MEKNNLIKENNCPYPVKIVRQKTAEKKPVGTFYHPTEKTYRDGKCPCGYVSKKGYKRHAYDKKDGKHVKHTYVHRTCVPNKGTPGKVLDEFKPIRLEEKNSLKPYNYKTSNNADTRFNKLLAAAKELSYRTVVLRLSQLRTLTKSSDPVHSVIYDEDMKRLKEWRIENPDLYKLVDKVKNKEVKIGDGHICDDWKEMGYDSRGECVKNQSGGKFDKEQKGKGHICDDWKEMDYDSRGECVKNQSGGKPKVAKKVVKPKIAKKVIKPKVIKPKVVKPKVVKPKIAKKIVKHKVLKK